MNYMKFKFLFLGLMVFIMLAGISTVSAENATVGDYTFTVPDEFSIVNQTEDMVYLEDSLSFYSISLTVADESLDDKEIMKRLLSQGYELEKEGNYTRGIFNVTEYTYNFKDAYYGFLYLCENGDDRIVITHGTSGEDEYFMSAPDLDVKDIIESLEKV